MRPVGPVVVVARSGRWGPVGPVGPVVVVARSGRWGPVGPVGPVGGPGGHLVARWGPIKNPGMTPGNP